MTCRVLDARFAGTRLGMTVALVLGCSDGTGPLAPVASIELGPITAVWVGDVRPLQATPRAGDGAALGGRTIAWSTTAPTIATIDGSGLLSALAPGSVTIAAESEGKRAEVTITIAAMDLVYEGFLGGSSEMLVLSLQGGAPVRVLPAGALVAGPVPSPDGTRIAFVATELGRTATDIYIVNRDGTGLYRLTNDPGLDENPTWSPDGARIAYRNYLPERLGDIWVVNVDGTNPVNLTPGVTVTEEKKPAWSPDGTRIAFASTRGGTHDIWTMKADGTDLVQVTSTPEYDTEPSWSPEGGRIAFRRSNDVLSDIFVINVHGGPEVRLDHPGHELMPAWSPNGQLIAYAQFALGSVHPQIYTMRPDGRERTLRTTDLSWNGGIEPAWLRR